MPVSTSPSRPLRARFLRARAVLATVVAVGAALLGATACSRDQPTCTGGLTEYDGKCLTNTAIVYMECTRDRGISTDTQIGGGLSGTFRVVADASIELAYKKSTQENTPVALQIVHDCLKIAEAAATSAPERSDAQQLVQRTDDFLKDFRDRAVAETPHITLSAKSGGPGDVVTVTGTSFWANETVAIYVHATLVEQVVADAKGAFVQVVTIPASTMSFSTNISASGESSAKSARAPFKVT